MDIRCRLLFSLDQEHVSKATCFRPLSMHCNAGYTLLELMLALALLGALMTVAWTLLGTYRDAELRGWKLAHRTQTIRAARQWLVNDVQHLLRQDSVSPGASASQARLSGNSLGFTASIAPSVDPLPFLQLALSNPQTDFSAGTTEENTANLANDGEALVTQAQLALWPADTLQIEYTLTPLENQGTATISSPLQPTNPSDVQFSLTRRELLDASSAQNSGYISSNAPQLDSATERVLTAGDLYRQSDDSRAFNGHAIHENRLDGLTNVRFQYYDGVSWKLQWNSEQVGGLPIAIALVFDFPARSEIQPSADKTPSAGSDNGDGLTQSGDLATSETSSDGLPFADAALAAESLADTPQSGESNLMQNATHEVQIVVYIGERNIARVDQRLFGSRASGGFE